MGIKEEVIKVLSDKPKLQRDIIKELKENGILLNDRALRSVFKNINKDFIYGDTDFVIISNGSGSYISKDESDIRKFNENKIKHAKSELWSAYNTNKRLTKNATISFKEYLESALKDDLYD